MAIRQYARDDDQAEDLLQECWIQILERLDSYSPYGGFTAWAIAVSRNVCRTKLRSEDQAGASEVTFGDMSGWDEAVSTPGSPAPEGSRQHLWKRAVHEALGRLPDRERDVIVLRLLQGRETSETAAALGVSERAVRSILHRGMTRLRKMEELRELLPEWTGCD